MAELATDYLVWVDLEMTGLNIDRDRIIEMAVLITDKDLNLVAEVRKTFRSSLLALVAQDPRF
jgi:oligoribonuclease (3'-5' exoribonuclease)